MFDLESRVLIAVYIATSLVSEIWYGSVLTMGFLQPLYGWLSKMRSPSGSPKY